MSASSSSSMTLQSAQSPDQSLVAVVVPPSSNAARGLVQIYQVTSSSCQLQLTLTHNNNNGNNNNANSAAADRLQELIFCGSAVVVARCGISQIVLWDLDRGVVSQTIQARDDEEFLGLASTDNATDNDDSFYILTKYGSSNKLVVQEYSGSTGKLLRKIKSGRWEGSAAGGLSTTTTLCVSTSHVVVQTAPGYLRVMDSHTGKKLGKIKAGAGKGSAAASGGGVVFTSMKLVQGKSISSSGTDDTLVAIQSGGTISFYNASKCEETNKPIIYQAPAASAPVYLSSGLLQLTKDLNLLLVDNTIFAKNESASSASSYEQLTTLQSAHPMAPFLTRDGGRVMVLVHQKRTGCQAQWVDLEDNASETTNLDQLATAAALEAKEGVVTTSTSSTEKAKRKSTESMILGPGQAGAEIVVQPAKRPKVVGEESDHDENQDEEEPSAKDISIAERLQQLTNALDDDDEEDADMDEESTSFSKPTFKPHRATTESLKELLSQALQAGDDSLLELALAVRDVKVISTTLKDIGSSRIVILLSKLTTRLATNPLRAEGLALWLSHCLKQGRFQTHHLAPLRNLLYERTESFSDLLRLEGRLALMCDVE